MVCGSLQQVLLQGFPAGNVKLLFWIPFSGNQFEQKVLDAPGSMTIKLQETVLY